MLDIILVGLNTLAVLAALGAFMFTDMLYERPLPSPQENYDELIEKSKEQNKFTPLKLDKMIINLKGKSSRLRFLEIEPHLIPFKPQAVEILEGKKAFIYDSIIDIASNFSPEQINSVSGKILFEERIKKRIMTYFGKAMIKEVFFSKFVVQ